jgi:hypothetical protein
MKTLARILYFVAYSTFPVLSNITLRNENNQIIDAEPPIVRDLFAARHIVITGKLRDHQQGKLILSGMHTQKKSVMKSSTLD